MKIFLKSTNFNKYIEVETNDENLDVSVFNAENNQKVGFVSFEDFEVNKLNNINEKQNLEDEELEEIKEYLLYGVHSVFKLDDLGNYVRFTESAITKNIISLFIKWNDFKIVLSAEEIIPFFKMLDKVKQFGAIL